MGAGGGLRPCRKGEPRARTRERREPRESPGIEGNIQNSTHENRACCEIVPPPGRSVSPPRSLERALEGSVAKIGLSW